MTSKYNYVRQEVAKGQTRPHRCHARGCNTPVPPAFFMCAPHWRLVPTRLQVLIWKHYKPGQEKGEVEVSEEYARVSIEAVNAVAKLEGR
jgi:hypothetical protein